MFRVRVNSWIALISTENRSTKAHKTHTKDFEWCNAYTGSQTMKHHKTVLFAIALSLLGASIYCVRQIMAAGDQGTKRHDAAAVSAFQAIIPVLQHPRCMNCHSSGDFPRQGDDGHPHDMNVRRGPLGQGVTAQKCTTCHQDHNLAGPDMPPGAADWHLPPPVTPMIWEGLSGRQLCELFKDRKQNGNRDVREIIEHMETPLVKWGWAPGEGRTPISSMTHAEFMTKVREWVNNGAACP